MGDGDGNRVFVDGIQDGCFFSVINFAPARKFLSTKTRKNLNSISLFSSTVNFRLRQICILHNNNNFAHPEIRRLAT